MVSSVGDPQRSPRRGSPQVARPVELQVSGLCARKRLGGDAETNQEEDQTRQDEAVDQDSGGVRHRGADEPDHGLSP